MIGLAARMGFREYRRQPVLLILLVIVPAYFISRSIAVTLPTPRTVALPGGTEIVSNMRDLHGANMAAIAVGFLAGLCGQFIMQSARQADRRLVIAGYRPLQVIVPRLLLLFAAIAVVLATSLAVTAFNFDPAQWGWFALGSLLVGLIYGCIGALAGAALGRLGATYLMFFLPFFDIGIAQNPMFGDGDPDWWARFLPSYGPMRVVTDGAFSPQFHAGAELALALAWTLLLTAGVGLVLRKLIAANE